MSKHSFGLASIAALAFLYSAGSFAGGAISSLCTQNQIRSFAPQTNFALGETPSPLNTSGSLTIPFLPEFDYCGEEMKIPPEVISWIRSAGELNSKAAAVFGVTADQAIPEPFNIFIIPSELGVLQSIGGTLPGFNALIGYTVFPDWKGAPIDRGIYSHELGHVLSFNSSKALPSAYHELSRTSLGLETVADTLALEADGTVFGDSPDLLGCMKRLRNITEFQSYAAPRVYFTFDWTQLKELSCCREFEKKKITDSHWTPVCKKLIPLTEKKFGSSTPDLKTPFDPAELKEHPETFDPHQLGIPLNSFNYALKEATREPTGKLFIQSFFDASVPGVEYPAFRCEVPKLAGTLPAQTIHQISMETLLSIYRKKFSSPQKAAAFDSLWKSHRLDVAVEIARIDAAKLAALQAAPAFLGQLTALENQAPQNPALATSGCDDSDLQTQAKQEIPAVGGPVHPECAVVCTAL